MDKEAIPKDLVVPPGKEIQYPPDVNLDAYMAETHAMIRQLAGRIDWFYASVRPALLKASGEPTPAAAGLMNGTPKPQQGVNNGR